MTRKINHSLLDNAKSRKSDEFYTLYPDIQRELVHYESHFHDKIIFCNCDDPRKSNFFRYFADNFHRLKIKKIICSCWQNSQLNLFNHNQNNHGFYLEYTGQENINHALINFQGDGDFRSDEVINLLKKSDIVVTNPPFSLFREYLSQLINHKKKFLIISNINAITYKEVFTLIQENKIWLGINFGRGISGFVVPDNYELYGTETKINHSGQKIISPNNCLWLTNLDNSKRHEFIALTKKYYGNETNYQFYDNFPAVNTDKTENIPIDYPGVIGVPISFLHKFNPQQFEIIGFRKGNDGKDLSINGKYTYFRILIKHKKIPH